MAAEGTAPWLVSILAPLSLSPFKTLATINLGDDLTARMNLIGHWDSARTLAFPLLVHLEWCFRGLGLCMYISADLEASILEAVCQAHLDTTAQPPAAHVQIDHATAREL